MLTRAAWPARLVLGIALGGACSQGSTQAAPRPIRLTWMGHAGFEIVSPGGTRVLIDPWISGNPAVPAAYADTARYAAPATRPAVILVTPSPQRSRRRCAYPGAGERRSGRRDRG